MNGSSSLQCRCTYSELVEDDFEQHEGGVDRMGVDGVEGNRGLAALVVGISIRSAVDGDPETDDGRAVSNQSTHRQEVADGRT